MMGDMADMVNEQMNPDDWAERNEIICVHEFVRESEKAWLVNLKEGTKITEHWFPKSQCELSDDKKSIEVPTWLLNSKGIS